MRKTRACQSITPAGLLASASFERAADGSLRLARVATTPSSDATAVRRRLPQLDALPSAGSATMPIMGGARERRPQRNSDPDPLPRALPDHVPCRVAGRLSRTPGKRSQWAAMQAKREGLATGFPDMMASRSRRSCGGLEFKAEKGRLSDNQAEWQDRLARHGVPVRRVPRCGHSGRVPARARRSRSSAASSHERTGQDQTPWRERYELNVRHHLPRCSEEELKLRCSIQHIKDTAWSRMNDCSEDAHGMLHEVWRLAVVYGSPHAGAEVRALRDRHDEDDRMGKRSRTVRLAARASNGGADAGG
jgi:hypothetical protein